MTACDAAASVPWIYRALTVLQVLAVDLLNPTPQAEARKHKLKVGEDIILGVKTTSG